MNYLLLQLNHLIIFGAAGDPCNLRAPGQSNSFFGFPNWWKYVKEGTDDGLGRCVPKFDLSGGLSPLWSIAFAIVDMLLYLAGIVAVIMIIIGGISYITSSGNAEKAAQARGKIIDALIGLAIVVLASAVVSFIGNRLGG